MPSTKGNVYVKYGNGAGVYLYTAKYGHILPVIVQAALLKTRSRWGDTPAIARAIFAEMIQKDVFNPNDAGISPTLDNNENFILVVDDKTRQIGICGEIGHCYALYHFDQFLNDFAANQMTMHHLSGGHRLEREQPGVNRNRPDPYPFPSW